MSPEAKPRPGLRDTDPYSSPQLDVPVRLNTNECPFPLSEAFADDLASAVRELALNRYPAGDFVALREAIAAHSGHPLEGVWAASGSNEIILQLLQAYGGPERSALLFTPTYELHSRIAWVTHTDVVEVALGADFAIGVEHVAAAIAVQPDIVIVCSPNNPTGNAQPIEVVSKLAEALDALVVVDEAYIEFGGTTALGLVAERPNIVVLRTMSKAFALAGARLGYCLSDPRVVDDLRRVRLPYHLSALAQAAALIALRHSGDALAILDEVRGQRDRILEELSSMPGVTAYPSDANFVLFRPPGDAVTVWKGLLERGVLVRDLTKTVPGCLRVTAGTPDEVTSFLDAMKEVLA